MSTNEFLDSPWLKNNKIYKKSVFHVSPAPEYSTAEVTLSSLYRASGFSGYTESKVPSMGVEFKKQGDLAKNQQVISGKISPQTWRILLNGVLDSPKSDKQSKSRNIQLCPIVPDIALYSGSPRLKGNSWNPGELLKNIIIIGSKDQVEADYVWAKLFGALSISDDDDVWARWLEEIFEQRKVDSSINWSQTTLKYFENIPSDEKISLSFPAKQFVFDLLAIIESKSQMTRKQWVSLLEAVIRVGVVTHVLWLCKINDSIWKACHQVLFTENQISNEYLINTIFLKTQKFFSYGKPVLSPIRAIASRYLVARLGINLVLWMLEDLGETSLSELNSKGDLIKLLQVISHHKDRLLGLNIVDKFNFLKNKEAKVISIKQGTGSSLEEFFKYNLGQLQPANQSLRGYDQGYFAQKKGSYRNSPWVLSFGPVAVLAMVYCCLSQVKGPRSISRLSNHLNAYGLDLGIDEISNGDLGRKLRMLGLVLDSPDAESGMLLVPPFAYNK